LAKLRGTKSGVGPRLRWDITVPPVDMSSLIPMAIKEEDREANVAAMDTITARGLEQAARRAERKEQVVREDAERVKREKEEKERKKAAIKAELQAFMAKKAELEEGLSKPTEPKTELVEETAAPSGWSDFIAPIGWHFKGKYLVQDDEEPEVNMNIEYELEYH
jgi:hypothetical protein